MKKKNQVRGFAFLLIAVSTLLTEMRAHMDGTQPRRLTRKGPESTYRDKARQEHVRADFYVWIPEFITSEIRYRAQAETLTHRQSLVDIHFPRETSTCVLDVSNINC